MVGQALHAVKLQDLPGFGRECMSLQREGKSLTRLDGWHPAVLCSWEINDLELDDNSIPLQMLTGSRAPPIPLADLFFTCP